jgi:hypothetical protein
MNWDCIDTEERLSDFLDGAMSAEETAAFSGHAAECTRCAELVAQVGGLVRRMQRTEAVEMPERLVRNILDATLGPQRTQRRFDGWFGWAQAIWQPRFAMGVLTVASSFAIVVHASGVIPATISWADLNPANVVRSANRQAHLTYGRAEKFVADLQLVYEIRSQLEPDTQAQAPQQAVPLPESNPEQQTEPQRAPDTQPKSQVPPHGGSERSHERTHDGHLLVFANTKTVTEFN